MHRKFPTLQINGGRLVRPAPEGDTPPWRGYYVTMLNSRIIPCPPPTVLHPGAVQRDPSLTLSAKAVYRKLYEMRRRFKEVYPSIAYLARECGVCVRTVKSALCALRAHGLLRTRKRGFRSVLTYWLVEVARTAFERILANSAAIAHRYEHPNLSGGPRSFKDRERGAEAAKRRLLREQARTLLAQEAHNTA